MKTRNSPPISRRSRTPHTNRSLTVAALIFDVAAPLVSLAALRDAVGTPDIGLRTPSIFHVPPHMNVGAWNRRANNRRKRARARSGASAQIGCHRRLARQCDGEGVFAPHDDTMHQARLATGFDPFPAAEQALAGKPPVAPLFPARLAIRLSSLSGRVLRCFIHPALFRMDFSLRRMYPALRRMYSRERHINPRERRINP